MATKKNPWENYPKSAPFVLEMDSEIIQKNNQRYDSSHKFHMHTHLFAEPFVGYPNAPVYILNHNPGFSNHSSVLMENPEFIKIVEKNLAHDSEFYIIDPQMEKIHEIGFKWWTRKLKPLIDLFGLEKIRKNIFNVELGPYHSKDFKFLKLPSLEYTKYLVGKAMDEKKLIISMRSGNWDKLCPSLNIYNNLIKLKSPQAAVISKNNLLENDWNKLIHLLSKP